MSDEVAASVCGHAIVVPGCPGCNVLMAAFFNTQEKYNAIEPCSECKCRGYHEPECAIEEKRRAMQAKLEGVQIDPARLRPRAPHRRVHVVGIEARTTIAKEILLAMIGNGGDKLDKVRAAVEYTDLLLSELGGGVQPFGGDDE